MLLITLLLAVAALALKVAAVLVGFWPSRTICYQEQVML
jgi:hypothetical protein